MTSIPFEYSDDLRLIIVPARVGEHALRLALDTRASNTVIDLNDLLIAGFWEGERLGRVEFETASGRVDASLFRLPDFEALGESRPDYEVYSYDFLVNGVLSEISGVLGLDFFAGRHFCIDMDRRQIHLYPNPYH